MHEAGRREGCAHAAERGGGGGTGHRLDRMEARDETPFCEGFFFTETNGVCEASAAGPTRACAAPWPLRRSSPAGLWRYSLGWDGRLVGDSAEFSASCTVYRYFTIARIGSGMYALDRRWLQAASWRPGRTQLGSCSCVPSPLLHFWPMIALSPSGLERQHIVALP